MESVVAQLREYSALGEGRWHCLQIVLMLYMSSISAPIYCIPFNHIDLFFHHFEHFEIKICHFKGFI